MKVNKIMTKYGLLQALSFAKTSPCLKNMTESRAPSLWIPADVDVTGEHTPSIFCHARRRCGYLQTSTSRANIHRPSSAVIKYVIDRNLGQAMILGMIRMPEHENPRNALEINISYF
jgi:hypothetical protein